MRVLERRRDASGADLGTFDALVSSDRLMASVAGLPAPPAVDTVLPELNDLPSFAPPGSDYDLDGHSGLGSPSSGAARSVPTHLAGPSSLGTLRIPLAIS